VSRRWLYLDNVKVLLIATIIAVHAVLGYSQVGWWSYADVREVTLSPVTETAMLALAGPFGLFVIALLFLVAGLLTGPSLHRKGAGRFSRDRLLRLGVPFVVYVALVQPALLYALYHPLGTAPGSYWHEFLGAERQLDTGPLWFVGVLLIYSLVYAAWVRLRRSGPPDRGSVQITIRRLLLLAAAVIPATFLIRVVYPLGGDSGFSDLNLWQWPACIALFGLGITAYRNGWLTAVPGQLWRQSRTVALATVGAFVVFAAVVVAFGAAGEQLFGGWHWSALAFVTLESVLTVFGPVWLLGAAQQHLGRRLRWGAALGRSAYGAFVVQGPILIGLAVVLRPLPLPAEVKALIVAAGGVATSFALAWLLVTRVPFIRRII
jgi:hypothetical protein